MSVCEQNKTDGSNHRVPCLVKQSTFLSLLRAQSLCCFLEKTRLEEKPAKLSKSKSVSDVRRSREVMLAELLMLSTASGFFFSRRFKSASGRRSDSRHGRHRSRKTSINSACFEATASRNRSPRVTKKSEISTRRRDNWCPRDLIFAPLASPSKLRHRLGPVRAARSRQASPVTSANSYT